MIRVKLSQHGVWQSAVLVRPKPMAEGGRVLARRDKTALFIDNSSLPYDAEVEMLSLKLVPIKKMIEFEGLSHSNPGFAGFKRYGLPTGAVGCYGCDRNRAFALGLSVKDQSCDHSGSLKSPAHIRA